MARELAAITPEQLERLLDALEEMQALRALGASLEEAKKEALDEELTELLQKLARLGVLQGNGGLGDPGIGEGGSATKAPDDGKAEETLRVKGQLDPKGRLGPRVAFSGIPKPNESQLEFDRAIGRAADDAAESLGRDEMPRSARPFVRRYFDALREGR